MDVGATLRNARERRGLSLESLSRITRIKPGFLHAIEANAFDKVPGGIFLRGFLRSYAGEVGLDPETVVQGYVEQFEVSRPEAASSPAPRLGSPPPDDDSRPVFDPAWLRPRVTAQWAAIAVVVAAFAGYSIFSPHLAVRGSRSPRASVPAGAATADARPASSSGDLAPVGTVGPALRVDIAPTGPCWISATADGERVLNGLLQSGDRRTITVHDAVVLRVGDPGTLRYTINGIAGRPLGRPAEAVTVTIAPANFREFLAR
jgi:cytoskeleton protein RodZ